MSETYTPDNLIAGDYPVVTDIVTIGTEANLVRGTLLGKITATGKYVLCDTDGTDDGRRTPAAILGEDAAAASADVEAVIYLSGAFNAAEVVFATGETAATHRAALRDLNIYVKNSVAN
jgi:hypothetical protein